MDNARKRVLGGRLQSLRRGEHLRRSLGGGAAIAFLFLLGAAFSRPASCTTLRFIEITGNESVSAREVLGWLTSGSDRPFLEPVLENDLHTIAENYRLRGYLGAHAAIADRRFAADSQYVDVTIRIEEGRRSIIGAITFTGLRQFAPAEALSQFDAHPGDPLDETLLERDIDALLARYDKLGYAFAQCAVAGIKTRPGTVCDSLEMELAVDEGERLTIDEIKVEGNKETNASVVVREARFKLGETYNPSKISAVRQRLNRLNIFSSVAEPEVYVRDRKGGLLLKVVEGSTNTFDGILGYMPAGPDGGGYLTGLASVSMRNLFGTGRKLSFQWQREDRFSQELGVRYVEPWFLGVPVNLGGGLLQRQQDTSYVRRTLDLRADLMLSEELTAGVLFGSESVIPSAVALSAGILRSSSTSGGFEIQYDSRDDIYSPTGGARYVTNYQYGRRRVSSLEGTVSVQRIGLDLDFFVHTLPRQVFAAGLHGRDVQGGEIDETQMYRFGGANSLRGYRENQFLGSRVGWTNLEYRFLLARRSFFFGFFDTGYYFRPGDDIHQLPKSEAFRYGYGFGIRLDTSLGNLGVSFALGQGDSLVNGKVHFGLINEF